MKPSLITALVIVSSLLGACTRAPTPALEPASPTLTAPEPAPTLTAPTVTSSLPTDTPMPTNTPLPTDTPVPTDTPLPTDTPAPTPTDTPVPEPTATLEPTPTLTPTVELLPPLTLLEPAEGDTFATVISRPTFRWSEAPRPLAEDEYYVLIITHRDGKDFVWTKTAAYTAGDDKTWWVDYGPQLRWQVVTARKRTGEAAEEPTGNETGAYSMDSGFFWYE